MYQRLLSAESSKSFFLFGPRGCGKSSWLRRSFPKGVLIDLLEARVFNELLADPQRLGTYIPPHSKNQTLWLLIDEVQKVPSLLDEVHRLIELHKNIKFVMTGSSARKLRKTQANLLAGRALTHFMYPLTALELGKDFDLDHSLKFGCLPSVYVEPQAEDYLASYVRTYLQEEVQQEGLTRNLSQFSRFLEAASFSQTQILNISSVARDCAIERKMAESYFNIAQDLLLGFRLPAFTKKAKRRLVHHPKFFFFDTGVYRALRPRGPLDRPEEIEGHALETLCVQEMRALNDYLKWGYQLYFWRSATQLEVDLVAYGEKGLKAFEIKRTHKIQPKDLRALKAFKTDYPSAECYLIYGGDRQKWEDGIECLPVETYFKNLKEILERE